MYGSSHPIYLPISTDGGLIGGVQKRTRDARPTQYSPHTLGLIAAIYHNQAGVTRTSIWSAQHAYPFSEAAHTLLLPLFRLSPMRPFLAVQSIEVL